MRHISTSKTPVHSVEDVKGLKVRVPEINTYVDLDLVGRSEGLMPITELYMALKNRWLMRRTMRRIILMSKVYEAGSLFYDQLYVDGINYGREQSQMGNPA